MLSKLSVFIIVVVAVIGLDAACPENQNNAQVTNEGKVGTTTLEPLAPVSIGPLYHICPRSMNNWLLQAYKVVLKCVGGPSNNKCKGSSCGAGLVCCQDTNGCNQCVVPCPVELSPPNNCKSGYQAYNSPEGCAHFECNELLDGIKAKDSVAVEAAYTAKRLADEAAGLVPTEAF